MDAKVGQRFAAAARSTRSAQSQLRLKLPACYHALLVPPVRRRHSFQSGTGDNYSGDAQACIHWPVAADCNVAYARSIPWRLYVDLPIWRDKDGDAEQSCR